MNQMFLDRQKYDLQEKKFQQKYYKILQIFLGGPFSLVLSFFGHNLCSRALIEKKNYIT